MRRPLVILGLGLLSVALLMMVGATVWYERPAKLTVAISSSDTDDFALIGAAEKLMKFGKDGIRLQVKPVESAAAAAAAVDGGQADLAVIRTDVAIPSHAQTVIILHRDAVLIAAPGGSAISAITDLVGHTIGIVHRGPGNQELLETALAQYDIAPDAVKIVSLAPENVTDALKSKTVDAVMAVDVISSSHLRNLVKAVASAGEGAPVLVPIEEAEAIAQRSPAYEKMSVLHGAFGGTPPRPADDYDTLAITHRLVAHENVAVDTVTELTRFLLSEKQQIAAIVPIAQKMEAPSTDKDAAMPVHAGAAAYIDDDEQTFFDKYSDMIYLGAMFLGVMASGATAVLGRINSRRTASVEESVRRLVEILGLARSAGSGAALDALQNEADGLLASALKVASATGGDEGRLAIFGLALDQVRAAVRDRRDQLTSTRPFENARSA